jgi:uncharacterized protein YceK
VSHIGKRLAARQLVGGNAMKRIVLSAAILLAGCATITKGTDQQVSIDTPGHSGAICTLSSKGIGQREVNSPTTIELPKSKHDIAVSCVKGCYKGSGVISSNIEGMTAGNVLLGGVVGLGVDSASGAMNRYNSNNQFAMSLDPACVPTQ